MRWLYQLQHWLYALDSSFISWLFQWQELIGAILGAIAVASTVGWTLSSEQRRRKKEEQALRAALGAELRQLANRILKGHKELVNALMAANVVHHGPVPSMPITVQHAANAIRFPERTIYSNTARNIGLLGDYARKVVGFYGQLSLLEQVMRRTEEGATPGAALGYGEGQILAAALLNAASAAADALPAFAEPSMAQFDARYLRGVIEAHAAFEKFKPAPQDVN